MYTLKPQLVYLNLKPKHIHMQYSIKNRTIFTQQKYCQQNFMQTLQIFNPTNETYPHKVFIQVGRFPFYYLNCHDAKTPDVNFWSILFPSHHFRRHPIWRSHHRCALWVLWRDLSTEVKTHCKRTNSASIQVAVYEVRDKFLTIGAGSKLWSVILCH